MIAAALTAAWVLDLIAIIGGSQYPSLHALLLPAGSLLVALAVWGAFDQGARDAILRKFGYQDTRGRLDPRIGMLILALIGIGSMVGGIVSGSVNATR